MNIVITNLTATNNWWPVTDEEWERLNFPEKFKDNK